MLVALGAWILHVAALAMAPLSLVQAVISGGLVFLTVLADRFFGCSVGPRQWAGVGLTALGLCLLAVTLPHGTDASSAYSTPGMIAFEAGLLGVGHAPGLLTAASARTTSTTACSWAPRPASSSASPTWPSRP